MAKHSSHAGARQPRSTSRLFSIWLLVLLFVGLGVIRLYMESTRVSSGSHSMAHYSIPPNLINVSCPRGLSYAARAVPLAGASPVHVASEGNHVRTENDDNDVERVIYAFVNESVPRPFADNMRRSREALTGFRHLYFSERAMRTYIRHRHNTTVLDAFDSVRSLELKIELFKWLYLWTDGGIFVHLTATVTSKFRDMILKPELREQLLVSHDGSIVAVPPRNAIVFKLMTHVLTNLERRLYTDSYQGLIALPLIHNYSHMMGAVKVLPITLNSACALGEVLIDGAPVVEVGFGRVEYDIAVSSSEVQEMWSSRRLYYQDLVTGRERNNEELEARTRCPFGHTEIISYHPIDTPVEEQVTIEVSMHEKRRVSGSEFPKQAIPKLMMQTNRDNMVPEGMFEAVKALRALHPDYEHFYYSDTTARQFLIENTNDTFVEVFDTLVPGAYKADFFRYVWLYTKGGVYVDIDEVALGRIPLNGSDSFVSALDVIRNTVYNAFMASTPEHPILRTIIRGIIYKVTTRQKCKHPLAYTGPVLLGFVVRHYIYPDDVTAVEELKADYSYPQGVRLVTYTKMHFNVGGRPYMCSIGYLTSNGNPWMITRYPTYKRDMKWYSHSPEHYWDLCTAQRILAPAKNT